MYVSIKSSNTRVLTRQDGQCIGQVNFKLMALYSNILLKEHLNKGGLLRFCLSETSIN